MLTSRDYKQVLDIIDTAYSTYDDTSKLFQVVFEKLQKLIRINSAGYIPWNAGTRNFQFDGHVLFNASSKDLALYLQSYASLDPYIENGIHLSALNRAVKITDFVSVAQYEKTRYVREYAPMIPCFYEINAMLSYQGDPIGGLAFHRQPGERDFTEREREILNVLLPHLSNAVHKMELLDVVMPSEEIGVIVLGPKGRPLYVNGEARKALNGASVMGIPDPGLSAESTLFRSGATTYRVRTSQARCNKKWKVVYLEPHPAQHDLETKLSDYGLSKREREIALWVIRGLSNRTIAERLFICEQTVKDHLHDIFDKMKIHRRAELAAKIYGLNAEKS